jgi:hypothetical protein
MRGSELKEAERLDSKLRALGSQRSGLSEAEEVRALRVSLESRLHAIGEVVMRRELGVSKYTVLRVVREDGLTVHLQLLTVEISRSGGSLSWWLSGVGLRKDNSIGSRPQSVGFTRARLSRRTLQDEWLSVVPLGRCRGLNDPYGK